MKAPLPKPAKRPLGLRAWIRRLHLILGLSSGAIVFILGLTGCSYAFESELQDLAYPFRRVAVREAIFLPASVLRARAAEALEGKPIDWLEYSGRFLGMRGAHSRGEQLEWMYYDIHVGKLLGRPGQLLALFAGLTAASLPVTGLLMWWSRRRRKLSHSQPSKPA